MPMAKRARMNAPGLCTNAMPPTGAALATNSQVNTRRGPKRSHKVPTTIRATIVAATLASMLSLTSTGESCKSSRITGMSGATANQEKNAAQNATHVRWNARMGAVSMRNNSMRCAFPCSVTRSTSGLLPVAIDAPSVGSPLRVRVPAALPARVLARQQFRGQSCCVRDSRGTAPWRAEGTAKSHERWQ